MYTYNQCMDWFGYHNFECIQLQDTTMYIDDDANDLFGTHNTFLYGFAMLSIRFALLWVSSLFPPFNDNVSNDRSFYTSSSVLLFSLLFLSTFLWFPFGSVRFSFSNKTLSFTSNEYTGHWRSF